MVLRKTTLLSGLLLLVLIPVCLIVSGQSEKGRADGPPAIDVTRLDQIAETVKPAAILGGDGALNRSRVPEVFHASGNCIDAESLAAVETLILEGGELLALTDDEGQFNLQSAVKLPLTFRARGYADLSVAPSALEGNSILIRLVPMSKGTITFIRDGNPEPQVTAWTVKAPIDSSTEDRIKEHVSDETGQVHIPVLDSRLIAYRSARGEEGWVRARSGIKIVVELGGMGRKVILARPDGAPVVNAALRLRWGSVQHRKGVVATTNGEGVASLPSIRGPLRIEFENNSIEIVSATDSGLKVNFHRFRRGRTWVVSARTASCDLQLTCTVPLILDVQDVDSGEPITALGVWGEEHPGYLDPSSWRGLFENGFQVEAIEGKAPFPRQKFETAITKMPEENRLTLWFKGYEPWHVTDGEELLNHGTIRLRKRPMRSLRLLDASGLAYEGTFRIWDDKLGAYLSSGRVVVDEPNEEYFHSLGAAGIVSSLPWSGGSWKVEGLDMEVLSVVTKAELELNSVVEARCEFTTGTVVFEGVPDNVPPPVVSFLRPAMSTGRSRKTVARPTGTPGVWHATGLAPGPYMAGPAERSHWYQSLRRQEDNAFPSTVIQSGETVTVQWQDRWSSEAEVSGRIEVVSGSLESIRLLGIFGHIGERRAVSALKVDYPIRSDGEYLIPAGAYPPRALLVAREIVRKNDGQTSLIPLAVIQPGENIELDGSPLNIWSKSTAVDRHGVAVRVPVLEPLKRYVVYDEIEVFWPSGGDLTLPFVRSQNVESIRIRGRRMSDTIPLTSNVLSDRGYEISEFAVPPLN